MIPAHRVIAILTVTTEDWTTMLYQSDCISVDTIYNGTNRYDGNWNKIENKVQ